MKSKSRLSLKLNQPNTTTHKTEAIRRTERKTEAQTRQQPHLRLKGSENEYRMNKINIQQKLSESKVVFSLRNGI